MTDRPGRGSEQFVLRLPDGMRDRIAKAAKRNGRSMNTEIVSTLEARYPKPIQTSIDDIIRTIERISHNDNLSEEAKKDMEWELSKLREFVNSGDDIHTAFEKLDVLIKQRG